MMTGWLSKPDFLITLEVVNPTWRYLAWTIRLKNMGPVRSISVAGAPTKKRAWDIQEDGDVHVKVLDCEVHVKLSVAFPMNS